MINFSHTLANCSLHDLGFKGPQFTWNNKSVGTKNIQERLDRMVAHPVWKDLFPNYQVYYIDFLHSDHRPLHLTLNHKLARNRLQGFRFELFWLKEEDFKETLLSSWPSALLQDPLADLSSCLLSCSSTLNCWNTKKFAFGRHRKNEIIGILNDSGNWVTDGKNIELAVCHFFSNLFSSSNPSPEDVDGVAQAIHKTFLEEARSFPASPFTA
ncbi:hypothetical protein UlMin_035953 [Ulmus minor]